MAATGGLAFWRSTGGRVQSQQPDDQKLTQKFNLTAKELQEHWRPCRRPKVSRAGQWLDVLREGSVWVNGTGAVVAVMDAFWVPQLQIVMRGIF